MDALDDDLELLTRLAGVLRGDLRIRDAELEAALAAGDDACLRRLGHAVKNSAGTMRFDVLRARACQVEQAQKTDIEQAVTGMRAALREALDMLDKELGKELDGVDAMPGAKLVPCPVPGTGAGFAAGTAPAGCKGGC
jgi:HPt (histidine-containing phosphotransfer) domain-containing protein